MDDTKNIDIDIRYFIHFDTSYIVLLIKSEVDNIRNIIIIMS